LERVWPWLGSCWAKDLNTKDTRDTKENKDEWGRVWPWVFCLYETLKVCPQGIKGGCFADNLDAKICLRERKTFRVCVWNRKESPGGRLFWDS
jgi:hypothetical protein